MKSAIVRLAPVLAVFVTVAACVSLAPNADLSDASWILVGPFQNRQDASLSCPGFYQDWLTDIGGEPKAVLAEGTIVGGKHAVRAVAAAGAIDFMRSLGSVKGSVGYAFLSFESPGGEYALRMGSDDGVRAWLNGRLILDHHEHRSLNPNDEAVAVTLVPGTNRLLVKVDQGDGEWSMSCRLVKRSAEQAALEAMSKVGLAVVPSKTIVAATEPVACSVRTDPPLGLSVPVTGVLRDEQGNEIASVRAMTGEVFAFSPADGAQGVLGITATLGPGAPAEVADRLADASASATCVRGEPGQAFARSAARARAQAGKLAAAGGSDDRIATLEFLADRLEGKLHPTLETLDRKILAAGFVTDIVREPSEGGQGPLRGYRQYAYRSSIDGSLQPYSLYLPAGFETGRTYGLIVALHGFGGDDWSGGQPLARLAPEDFIIASPFGRGDLFYRSVAEQDVLDVMDFVMARYPVDPDRVYLTGISMGGLGTWRLGQMFADRFAAIAPFCGWTGTDFLGNLRNLPVLAVHGDKDTTVPVVMDRQATGLLKEQGFDVRYEELAGVGHDAWAGWCQTRDPRGILDYFRARRRQSSPERITATIPYARYGRQYWVRIDELAPADAPLALPRGFTASATQFPGVALPAAGSIDARRSSTDTVTISSQGVRALSVDLDLAGLDPKLARTVTIDGIRVPVPTGASSIALYRDSAAGWAADPSPPDPRKAKHTGGGMADLFTQPLLIVYGTQDPAQGSILEQAARSLAEWWGAKSGSLAVMADTQLDPEIAASRNILLVGTEKQNLATRLFAEAIRPFYADSGVSAVLAASPGRGLALTMPNPQAPAFLLGYIDAPPEALAGPQSSQYWFGSFVFRLTGVNIDETASWPGFCPDVMVLTANPFADAWSGWFDRNWSNLKGR